MSVSVKQPSPGRRWAESRERKSLANSVLLIEDIGRKRVSCFPDLLSLMKRMPSLAQEHCRNQQCCQWVSPPPPQQGLDEETEEGDRSEASADRGQHTITSQRSTVQLSSETDLPVGERRKKADRQDRDAHRNGRGL